MLEFRTQVDGLAVHGIDMIAWEANGRMTEFTVRAHRRAGGEAVQPSWGTRRPKRPTRQGGGKERLVGQRGGATVRILESKSHNNVLDLPAVREELFRFTRGERVSTGP